MIAFIKRAFLFLVRPVFDYQTCYIYIYEKRLNEIDEAKFIPKIQNYTLKIISTPTELEQLIADGFDFSSYLDADELKQRISKKAILFCVFIGKDLAHRSWVALSEEAKRDVDALPYSIDFETEALLGGGRTMPKYQGLGLHTYVSAKRFQFVNSNGLKAKIGVHKNNIPANKTSAKLGAKIYAEMRYLRFLAWESCREKLVREKSKGVNQ